MDPTPTQLGYAWALFHRIGKELRIPTATWLLSDYLRVVDSQARLIISTLITNGHLELTSGGWIDATKEYKA